jgi:hypothetical protein
MSKGSFCLHGMNSYSKTKDHIRAKKKKKKEEEEESNMTNQFW